MEKNYYGPGAGRECIWNQGPKFYEGRQVSCVYERPKQFFTLTQIMSRLSNVVVIVLATETKGRGFKPGRGDGF
jgi:hypothetical protein